MMTIRFPFQILFRFLPLALFALALLVLYHELQNHALAHVLDAVKATPLLLLGSAALLTLLNYAVLGGYDWLALRYTGYRSIPLPRILGVSFLSYAITNNTGQAWISGGAVRYRFYTAWGVDGIDVAKISLFLGLTYMIGVFSLGLVSGIVMPTDVRDLVATPFLLSLATVVSALALVLYWGMILFRRTPFIIRGMEVNLPSAPLALTQSVIACADLILASLVLWLFMKAVPGLSFEMFLMIYVMAQLLGLISQVPGGLGVFEGAFLGLMGAGFGGAHDTVLAALLLYRVTYYLMPLILAGLGLIFYEFWDNRRHLAQVHHVASQALSPIVPQIFSVLLFFTGAVLLVSGSLPPLAENMLWLERLLPLPVVEFSHLLGSITGLLLLFLARGVRLRLDAAWYGSLLLLALGIAASLLKGLDWQEALILGVMFAAMLLSQRFFYRRSSLLDVSFGPSWLLMIAVVCGAAIWLGFFSYKHVEYSSDLWWQFSYKGDASRFLRSLVVLGVTVLGLGFMKWMSVSRPVKTPAMPENDLADIVPLVHQSNDTQAFLALLGDKAFFWSADRRAALPYAITPGYWVVMGDPIGDPDAFEDLVWRFREQADQYAAKIVFYQVTERYLTLYLDLGLVLLKMGQDASVDLSSFSLEGKKRANLRGGRNKMTKLGFTFTVLEGEDVAQNIDRLQAVSNSWMAQKNTREKGFSLGFFDPAYIQKTSVAVVRDSEGTIMAFANLWRLDNHDELSIDLMRYDPESPSGIMDFLFAELLLWGQAQHYRHFNLGMAPLTGLERHRLAPLWHKVGTAVFDLGEEFYNFEGLYEYKAKFNPSWSPRYLAVPPGLSAPSVLLKVAALISGGWKGIFSR